MPRVLVLNGPLLNLLGRREPAVYGATTLAEIERQCHNAAPAHGLEVDLRQSDVLALAHMSLPLEGTE
ncbi:type II 3-dehydroquinate dehydratase [Nonomuraea turkmeniaca]|uniref:3-dehydroquinate dehydratase n=1 Tax=Nonomuraea turkmeniaca TaxID=103838 RepID=A0A5S4FMM7_9ACTN|nr:type II 3-dehydroquinate dehydratase [Nonomuraea turkmeniaca]TMR21923.1 type II 3-dehydroquinate dehydratase [Nonomuraea turkmeniaca]